jgi:mannose-6-phosphate isomerase-like protein (cupin superfamily)
MVVLKMLIRKLDDLNKIEALDETTVREILNPKHDGSELHLGYSLAHAIVESGESSVAHRFHTASEVYYILKGRGLMHINDESAEVKSGDTIYIPPKATQYIENLGEENLEFLCIVYPSWQPDAEELV